MSLEEFKIKVFPLKNKLFRFAKRMLNNCQEAEDVVQDVFLKLWSKKENLSDYRNIEAFSMTMTRNLCIDKLKSKKWKENEINEDSQEIDTQTPQSIYEMTESIQKIHLIINSLPEQQKEVVHLRDIEHLDFDEIADVSGLSINNIRVILSRARKKIRDEMIKLNSYEFSKN